MTKNKERASQIRRRLRELPGELAEALEGVLKQRSVLRGYVYRSPRRCGKPSCHCAKGQLHDALVLATRTHGRQTTRSLSGDGARQLIRLARNYRQFREGKRRVRRGFQQALRLMDELEELLSTEPPERSDSS